MLVKRPRLRVLRERWAPYLSDCLRAGMAPGAFHKRLNWELSKWAALRCWLDLHAAVCAVGCGENPVRRLERA